MDAPLAEGARIHYNFVKPHEALDGQTPAQAAGVGVDGRDKMDGASDGGYLKGNTYTYFRRTFDVFLTS